MEDGSVQKFLEFAKNDKDLPDTSDPIKLCEYLYLKLSPELTLAFQKMFLFFAELEPNNDLPKMYVRNQPLLLNTVNKIVDLQNNDPEYVF